MKHGRDEPGGDCGKSSPNPRGRRKAKRSGGISSHSIPNSTTTHEITPPAPSGLRQVWRMELAPSPIGCPSASKWDRRPGRASPDEPFKLQNPQQPSSTRGDEAYKRELERMTERAEKMHYKRQQAVVNGEDFWGSTTATVASALFRAAAVRRPRRTEPSDRGPQGNSHMELSNDEDSDAAAWHARWAADANLKALTHAGPQVGGMGMLIGSPVEVQAQAQAQQRIQRPSESGQLQSASSGGGHGNVGTCFTFDTWGVAASPSPASSSRSC